MLTQCGFPPGPVDGRWKQRTARAAADYIRAHGGIVRSGNEYSLIFRVQDLIVSAGGPCPNSSRDDQTEASAALTDLLMQSLTPEDRAAVREDAAAFNGAVLEWCDSQGGEFSLPAFFGPVCTVGDVIWVAYLGGPKRAAWWWDRRTGPSAGPVTIGILWFVCR